MRSSCKTAVLSALVCLSFLLLAPMASAASLFPAGGETGLPSALPLPEGLSSALAMGDLGPAVTPVVIAVAIVGILLAFLGYTLLRLTIFLGGFGTGIALSSLLLNSGRLDAALTSPWMPLVVMLILGAVGAWLFCKLFSLALSLTVLGAVLLVGMSLIKPLFPKPIVGILVVVLIAIVLSIMSTRFVKPIVATTTAAAGAFLFATALTGLIAVPHIKLVLFAVLLFLGLAVQLRAKGHMPKET